MSNPPEFTARLRGLLHFRENLPFCWQLQHIGEGIPNEGGEFLCHSWEGPADMGAEEKIKRLGWVEGGTAEVSPCGA